VCARVYRCRIVRDTIPLAVNQQSLIVIGRHRSWWHKTREPLCQQVSVTNR
jgi:hypothetical protein